MYKIVNTELKSNIYLQCIKKNNNKKWIIECDKGSFGVACDETCGLFRDVKQCNFINGTCLTKYALN